MGVKADWVDSGSKAVERVKLKWANGESYSIILVDWKMPEMDGIETARKIREIVGPDVTIIIMTAYDWVTIENEDVYKRQDHISSKMVRGLERRIVMIMQYLQVVRQFLTK